MRLNSFIKLPKEDSEYFEEAVDRFRQLCGDRKLIANVDQREGSASNPLLHLRLIDPSDAEPLGSSINVDLVREGLASLDKKGCGRYIASYPQVIKQLREASLGAKRDRLGMYEFGDIDEDDD